MDVPESELGRSPAFRERYTLQRKLGSGAYGAVYLARQERLGRPVAVKWLKGTADPAALRRFEQEARLCARIQDPHLVKVLDHGVEGENPFIVYEFVDGETVRARLERLGRLPPAEALELARQVALGLKALHEAGVVHRDLKPENVLLDAGGRARLTDLGIAKDVWGLGVRTETGVLLGTPTYMAPEVVRGEAVTPAADLYALGIMVHELLSGRPPFRGKSLYEVLDAHLKEAPPALAVEVAPGVADLVASLLAKDPRARPPDAAAVARSLAGPGAEPAPPAPPAPRPATAGRRSGAWVGVAAVVAATGLLLALRSAAPSAAREEVRPAPAPVARPLPDWRAGGAALRALAADVAGRRTAPSEAERAWLEACARRGLLLDDPTLQALAAAALRLGSDESARPTRAFLAGWLLLGFSVESPAAASGLAERLLTPWPRAERHPRADALLLAAAALSLEASGEFARQPADFAERKGLLVRGVEAAARTTVPDVWTRCLVAQAAAKLALERSSPEAGAAVDGLLFAPVERTGDDGGGALADTRCVVSTSRLARLKRPAGTPERRAEARRVRASLDGYLASPLPAPVRARLEARRAWLFKDEGDLARSRSELERQLREAREAGDAGRAQALRRELVLSWGFLFGRLKDDPRGTPAGQVAQALAAVEDALAGARPGDVASLRLARGEFLAQGGRLAEAREDGRFATEHGFGNTHLRARRLVALTSLRGGLFYWPGSNAGAPATGSQTP